MFFTWEAVQDCDARYDSAVSAREKDCEVLFLVLMFNTEYRIIKGAESFRFSSGLPLVRLLSTRTRTATVKSALKHYNQPGRIRSNWIQTTSSVCFGLIPTCTWICGGLSCCSSSRWFSLIRLVCVSAHKKTLKATTTTNNEAAFTSSSSERPSLLSAVLWCPPYRCHLRQEGRSLSHCPRPRCRHQWSCRRPQSRHLHRQRGAFWGRCV